MDGQAQSGARRRPEPGIGEGAADRALVWSHGADPMLVVGVDGTVNSVNPAWTTLFGWSEREVCGHEFNEFVHADDLATARRAGEQIRDGTTAIRFELRCLRRDGGDRRIDWSGVLHDGAVYAVGRDVTGERERAEARPAAQARRKHAQKMEALGRLAGGVAHDFNNVLQIIAGNLQLIARHGIADERIERRLNNALSAVHRGATLSSRLLAFGQRQTLNPAVTAIGRLVTGMADRLRAALGEGVEVEMKVAEGLWDSFVDAAQVEGAVLNLAINARDAMNGSGKLTIAVANVVIDAADARVEGELDGGAYVLIAVGDTGAGMTSEVLAQAFEPFFSTQTAGQGSGLGLSTVYGFARQSGGHAKIDSEPGRGTTVRLYLPRSAAGEAAAASSPVAA